jgi:nucleotide-binding universal stress UspA family protein
MADATPSTNTSSDHYSHIACCVEESRGSHLALAEASRLRAQGPGRLSVVHVFEAVPAVAAALQVPWVALNDGDEETMSEWLRELVGASGGEPVMLRGGSPAATVFAWADSEAVDLLVVGGLRGRLDRILRGDFTGWMVSHARCPVLVVKSD